MRSASEVPHVARNEIDGEDLGVAGTDTGNEDFAAGRSRSEVQGTVGSSMAQHRFGRSS